MNGQGKDAEEKTWLFFFNACVAAQMVISSIQSSAAEAILADHKQTRGYGHMQAMIKLPALYSQTSLIRTPKEKIQVSALQRCPYYRGRECMIFKPFLGPNELSVL